MKTELVRITDKRLSCVASGAQLWTTLEGHNPGGSIKDRLVSAELRRAIAAGEIKSGDRVSEISAGSTALSLAFFSREWDLRCSLFVPSTIDASLRERLQSLGAELHLIDPQATTAYHDYDDFCANRKIWRLDQMKRSDLDWPYVAWAEQNLRPHLAHLDLVIGAVGTGHSLRGIGKALTPQRRAQTAEPAQNGIVSGVRNLSLQSFGLDDPCRDHDFERNVLDTSQTFASRTVETTRGLVNISDSFRLVLAAAEVAIASAAAPASNARMSPEKTKPLQIFAVGSSNKL